MGLGHDRYRIRFLGRCAAPMAYRFTRYSVFVSVVMARLVVTLRHDSHVEKTPNSDLCQYEIDVDSFDVNSS